MKDYDKRTIITIDWYKERPGSFGFGVDENGDKLPREIRVMFVNSLLRDLRDVRVQVER